MPDAWKEQISALLAREDYEALAEMARHSLPRVLRSLNGRLASADEEEKLRAVRALGRLAAARELLAEDRLRELVRRYLWALNDESGAVPYGIPEALGEILAVRGELQASYLPILGSLLTEEEMSQTGPIERGVVWAAARIGPPLAAHCPEVAGALARMAEAHPDDETRRLAAIALARVTGREGEPDGGDR